MYDKKQILNKNIRFYSTYLINNFQICLTWSHYFSNREENLNIYYIVVTTNY